MPFCLNHVFEEVYEAAQSIFLAPLGLISYCSGVLSQREFASQSRTGILTFLAAHRPAGFPTYLYVSVVKFDCVIPFLELLEQSTIHNRDGEGRGEGKEKMSKPYLSRLTWSLMTELQSWVTGFQLCCKLYSIFSMRSSRHKPDYTIRTTRSAVFHLYQLQPNATSGPYWQQKDGEIYYTLKPVLCQRASGQRYMIYIYIAGLSSISEPYEAYYTCALIMGNPDEPTTCGASYHCQRRNCIWVLIVKRERDSLLKTEPWLSYEETRWWHDHDLKEMEALKVQNLRIFNRKH